MNPVVKSSSPGPTSTLRARRHAGAPEPSRRDSRDPGSVTCISSRPSCRTSLRATHFPLEKVKRCFHRNQQYSINAVTNGSAAVVERYAYSAYGTPTITNGSGTAITTSAISNRYAYTGREWDQALAIYHYRARMYDPVAGRFVSRDPIGYADGLHVYFAYFVPDSYDPTGEADFEDDPRRPHVSPRPQPRGPFLPAIQPHNPPLVLACASGICTWITFDTSIPDLSDACPPKWVCYVIVGGIAGTIIYCSADDELRRIIESLTWNIAELADEIRRQEETLRQIEEAEMDPELIQQLKGIITQNKHRLDNMLGRLNELRQ